MATEKSSETPPTGGTTDSGTGEHNELSEEDRGRQEKEQQNESHGAARAGSSEDFYEGDDYDDYDDFALGDTGGGGNSGNKAAGCKGNGGQHQQQMYSSKHTRIRENRQQQKR